jgi:myb proto-oncogene protein
LDPRIDRTSTCKAKWKEDEDIKLKAAVQNHGDKNWVAIAALVSGRTKEQCRYRWLSALDPSIALTAGCTGRWKEDEDIKLKAAVHTYGGKNWVAIAALVPDRTKIQCLSRWHKALAPTGSIALTAGSTGAWTTGEIIRLKGAIQTHGGKNWIAIAALVPGRTKIQCYQRWKKHGP